MSFTLRKLVKSDAFLARQLVSLFSSGSNLKPSDTVPDRHLQQMIGRDDFHVIVALENDKVIGGLTAYEMKMFKRETIEMFLYEIEVMEAYRGKGVAKALIEHLINICRERGIVEMFVGTESANLPANRLYKTTGGIADSESVWYSYKFS